VGRPYHNIPLNDFKAGLLTRLQAFDNLQASEFAATQVVPHRWHRCGAGRLWRLHPSRTRFVTSPRIARSRRRPGHWAQRSRRAKERRCAERFTAAQQHGTKAPFPSTATLRADDAGHSSPSTQLTRTHLQPPLVARQTLPLTLCS